MMAPLRLEKIDVFIVIIHIFKSKYFEIRFEQVLKHRKKKSTSYVSFDFM